MAALSVHKPDHDGHWIRFLNQLNSTMIDSYRYKSQIVARFLSLATLVFAEQLSP